MVFRNKTVAFVFGAILLLCLWWSHSCLSGDKEAPKPPRTQAELRSDWAASLNYEFQKENRWATAEDREEAGPTLAISGRDVEPNMEHIMMTPSTISILGKDGFKFIEFKGQGYRNTYTLHDDGEWTDDPHFD